MPPGAHTEALLTAAALEPRMLEEGQETLTLPLLTAVHGVL
jgi:hypothetical protein